TSPGWIGASLRGAAIVTVRQCLLTYYLDATRHRRDGLRPLSDLGIRLTTCRRDRQLQRSLGRPHRSQLRLLLTLKERATPIVRSRPSSVHMDSVWFKRTLWETRNTALKNHAEAQFIIAGGREPSEWSASYSLMQFIDHVVMTTCKSSINPRRLQY